MKLVYLLLFCTTLSHSQIVPSPKYDFEKVNWGDSYTKINQKFIIAKFELLEKSNNPFIKKNDDIFQYVFYDTVMSEKINVIFQFNSKDSTLISIYIFNMDIKNDSKDVKINEEKRIKILNALTSHYTSQYQERSVPFAGIIRVWPTTSSSIQAIILPSMLGLIFTKP